MIPPHGEGKENKPSGITLEFTLDSAGITNGKENDNPPGVLKLTLTIMLGGTPDGHCSRTTVVIIAFLPDKYANK